MAILISDKIDFRASKTSRDRERHFIMMKQPFHEVDIAILNVYAPNNRAAHYVMEKTQMKRETDKSTIIVGEFNIPLSTIDRKTRERISKVLKNLTPSTIRIYRTRHTTKVEYTFFSSTHRSYTQIECPEP